MFYLLTVRHCIKQPLDTIGTEQTHQIILKRNIETGLTRISLTTCTTTKLVINTAGLMTLCTDDLKTTELLYTLAKLNICTTTCHVCCDRYSAHLSGISDNLCLELMELRI